MRIKPSFQERVNEKLASPMGHFSKGPIQVQARVIQRTDDCTIDYAFYNTETGEYTEDRVKLMEDHELYYAILDDAATSLNIAASVYAICN